MTALPNGEKLTDYQYNYDLNGNRTAKQRAKHQTFYGYDVMNRLKTASYDGKEEQFSYDKVGNRLMYQTGEDEVFYGYNVKNQLVEMKQKLGLTLFTYDPQGNTIKEESNQGSRHFAYDTLGRQVKAVTEQGDTLLHRYDAKGLRCETQENEKVSKFIFHKGNLVAELNQEDEPVSRWIRGHEVVGVEKYEASKEDLETPNPTSLSRRYFYHQDEQGSTVSITNEHQEEVNTYHYDAFGKVLEAREGIANAITYTGQQYDQATQQYYLRARFYNPTIGRFTQEDVYRGDGLNLYAYCKANPVMYYDPKGYMGCNKDSSEQGKDDTPGTDKNNNGAGGSSDVIGELEYVHYEKKNKVTDVKDLNAQVQQQIDGLNRIITEEGMGGLKERVQNYGPEIEAEGRKYVKTLEPAPKGEAHLHVPDMKVGGAPTDVHGTGNRRNNSIIGGQADRISREILNMSDKTTKIIGKLKVIGVKE
jgi:RHS repeat-associated protein